MSEESQARRAEITAKNESIGTWIIVVDLAVFFSFYLLYRNHNQVLWCRKEHEQMMEAKEREEEYERERASWTFGLNQGGKLKYFI